MSLGLYQQRLEVLPGLLDLLLQAPLTSLNHGILPERDALYLFYIGDKPVTVGSPDEINAVTALGPSVRLGYRVDNIPYAPALTELDRTQDRFSHLSARWIPIDDPSQRKLLQLYVAEYLHLPPCHPDLAFLIQANPDQIASKT